MKSIYRFCVEETVKKYVEVEAESQEEAEQIALESDLDKNFDYYDRTATLETVQPSVWYPMYINGWNLADSENMTYWKDFGENHSEAVALCWIDIVEGEFGYNPEGDCYCLIWAENTDYESALESLYYSNATFGNVMRRKEAEAKLIKYMEAH